MRWRVRIRAARRHPIRAGCASLVLLLLLLFVLFLMLLVAATCVAAIGKVTEEGGKTSQKAPSPTPIVFGELLVQVQNESGAGIEGVQVDADGPAIKTLYTDEQGFARFQRLFPGQYRVSHRLDLGRQTWYGVDHVLEVPAGDTQTWIFRDYFIATQTPVVIVLPAATTIPPQPVPTLPPCLNCKCFRGSCLTPKADP